MLSRQRRSDRNADRMRTIEKEGEKTLFNFSTKNVSFIDVHQFVCCNVVQCQCCYLFGLHFVIDIVHKLHLVGTIVFVGGESEMI
jgi:hypothetical protein